MIFLIKVYTFLIVGISFYSCLFGMFVQEILAVIVLQNYQSTYGEQLDEIKVHVSNHEFYEPPSEPLEHTKPPARRMR